MTNAMQGLLHSVLSKKRLMPTHSTEVLASDVNSVTECNRFVYFTPSRCIITVWKTFFSLTLPLGVTLLFKQQWQQSFNALSVLVRMHFQTSNLTQLKSVQSISYKTYLTTWATLASNSISHPVRNDRVFCWYVGLMVCRAKSKRANLQKYPNER